MAELTLTRFDQDDLELFVDEATGRAYASIRATARMTGVQPSTISRWASVALIEPFSAEVQTAQGIRSVALLTAEQVFEAAVNYLEALREKRYRDRDNGPIEINQDGDPLMQGTWGDRQVPCDSLSGQASIPPCDI